MFSALADDYAEIQAVPKLRWQREVVRLWSAFMNGLTPIHQNWKAAFEEQLLDSLKDDIAADSRRILSVAACSWPAL